MSRLNEAKRRWDEATESGDTLAAERAAAIWKTVAEAEKLQLDAASLDRAARTEGVKFWVPVVGSMFGTAALVGTLILQISASTENARLQREAAEDTQYRDALKTIQDPRMMNAVVGFPMFKTFLDSPRYGGQAREVAVGLMGGIVDYERFRSLFDALVARTTRENLDDIVGVNRDVWKSFSYWDARLEKMKAEPAQMGEARMPPLGFGSRQLPMIGPDGFPEPEAQALPLEVAERYHNATLDMLKWCSKSLSDLLRQLPAGSQASDLSFTFLDDSDLTGADLSNANLAATGLAHATLANARLSNVEKFERSNWNGSAWWRAGSISPSLLEFLIKNYPFDPGRTYAGTPIATADEYRTQVAALQAGTSARP